MIMVVANDRLAIDPEGYLFKIDELSPIDRLLHWVREREAIRARKEDGGLPFPWTEDPILRTYRFCAVRREDDRVTRWIQNNIRRPYMNHPYLWFMLCIARMINWPETLADLMCSRFMDGEAWPDDPTFSPAKLGDALECPAMKARKVFTGAYIIPAPGKGETKGRFIAEFVLGNLWRDRARFESLMSVRNLDGARPPSLHMVHSWLTKYDYWGDFLAHQAVIDMRFCPTLLADSRDVQTWTVAGPGSTRGLNRLKGYEPISKPFAEDKFLREIALLRQNIFDGTGILLDASDVQGCLCEFDKYERVRRGEGKPRAMYVPGRGS